MITLKFKDENIGMKPTTAVYVNGRKKVMMPGISTQGFLHALDLFLNVHAKINCEIKSSDTLEVDVDSLDEILFYMHTVVGILRTYTYWRELR